MYCEAPTKSGDPCQKRVKTDDENCWIHKLREVIVKEVIKPSPSSKLRRSIYIKEEWEGDTASTPCYKGPATVDLPKLPSCFDRDPRTPPPSYSAAQSPSTVPRPSGKESAHTRTEQTNKDASRIQDLEDKVANLENQLLSMTLRGGGMQIWAEERSHKNAH